MLKGLGLGEKWRDRKNLLLAIAGGVLGVAASLLAYFYLEKAETQIQEKAQAEQSRNLVGVVVAKADLAAGATVGDDNMAIRQVPKDYVYPETVLPDGFDKARGQALLKPLGKGQPLLLAYLSESGASGLSDKLKEGRRAVSINVDEVSSMNGLIAPGDRIDLLIGSRNNLGAIITPLLQDVKVLATGSQFAPRTNAGGDDKFGLRYATLTLDVTPEESERIVLARASGTLTAVLRGRGDNTRTAPLRPLHADELFALSQPGPASDGQIGSVNYIMRGSQPGIANIFQVPVGLPTPRGATPVSAPPVTAPPATTTAAAERPAPTPEAKPTERSKP
jgi:pilus assembly protein CpaB